MAKTNQELSAKITNASSAPAVTPAQQIAAFFSKEVVKAEISKALPKHLTADRMMRMALTEIKGNPKLLECSIESLGRCVIRGAIEGLEFGTGHAYLVPFWNKKTGRTEAQYIRGYQGSIELVRRSGQLQSIGAGVVYSTDTFEFERGYEEKLRHVPNYKERGEIIGYYAYALLKDGGRQGEFMTLADINSMRERSKAKDYGPWVTDFNEMAKKTVLRRLCKLLPLSIEIYRSLNTDAETEFGDDVIDINLGEIPSVTKVEQLPIEQDEIPNFENGGTHKAVKEGELFPTSDVPEHFQAE